ncbi:uncharacterized protein BJ212DRAFT_1504375 [Suillus subaureus]|uniref:Uncharacterized protein n=1 Tax=Suillus subaureus TaxID=48587 RepID=A0A9P7EA81_9AGAM|nr:uncharacterized protein BJ212DRAFT_1504375 [Suillus subaureus]KAG1815963.1 hypothetical protein BJ212DRAFT_1504375 [Suillus subaureus]
MSAQKTKAIASWLKPLIPLLSTPPVDSCQCISLLQLSDIRLRSAARCKLRASRMNAACDGIVCSRLQRHVNRIVGDLAQVYEQIRSGQAALIDHWIAGMAEVMLASMLASNRQTSPLPHRVDAISTSELPTPSPRGFITSNAKNLPPTQYRPSQGHGPQADENNTTPSRPFHDTHHDTYATTLSSKITNDTQDGA